MYCIYSTQSRCRAQVPPAGLRTPLPRWDNINKGMHFFFALFFKIFFIFIFFWHIICVRRKNGGVKCRCLVGFLAFLLFVPRFPRPPPLQICGGALHFLTWRGLSGSGIVSAVGAVFFCSFFSPSVYLFFSFCCLFCALFTISFRLFFLVSFVFSLCGPLFWCVHYGETGSSPAGRCDCGGDEICVVETKAARLSLKGSSIHPGKKSTGCKWIFRCTHLLKIFFALKVYFLVCDRLKVWFW